MGGGLAQVTLCARGRAGSGTQTLTARQTARQRDRGGKADPDIPTAIRQGDTDSQTAPRPDRQGCGQADPDSLTAGPSWGDAAPATHTDSRPETPRSWAPRAAEASWPAGHAGGAGRPGARSRELGLQTRRPAGGRWVGARPAVQMHFMRFAEVRQSRAGSCLQSVGLAPARLRPAGPGLRACRSPTPGWLEGPGQPFLVFGVTVGGQGRDCDPDFAAETGLKEEQQGHPQ